MSKTTIPASLRWQVWERDHFRCLHCGSRRYLAIDHIIPESAGGKTEESNLQTLCSSCNSSKGNRLQPCQQAHLTVSKKNLIKLPIINMEFAAPHISVQDAAKALSRPRYTIYRWIEAGKIVGLRFGGILFIPVSEVERLKNVASQPAGGKHE